MTNTHFANLVSDAPNTRATVAIVISILAIVLPLIYQFGYQWRSKQQEGKAIRESLLQELLANMHGLFNEGIERPFLFTVFEAFLEKQSYRLKDKNSQSEFQKIISLYTELMDYRAVTDKYWPPKNDNDFRAHFVCTEKQVKTINAFLRYFGEDTVDQKPEYSELVNSRKKAQTIRNAKQEKWHQKLDENIRTIV